MKRGKSDGSSLSSNHFISAAPVLNVLNSRLFTVILRHGYIPSNIRDCILQLIPKPGKDPFCSDNYRPIVLVPTLSKILEWCILIAYHSAFSTSALQFGFKPGHSAESVISVLALLRMLLRSTVFPDPLFLAAFLMPQKPLIVLTMHYYLIS